MILPSKKLKPENSLIYIGSVLLDILVEPMTVSRLWEELKRLGPHGQSEQPFVTYDWFILSIDLLFIIGALDLTQGRINRRSR